MFKSAHPRASLSGKNRSRRSLCESLEVRRLLSTAIASGQTITASISAKAEVDTYTIHGVAGGTLMATVGETTSGSPLTPEIELRAPGGTVLTSNYSASGITVTSSNLAVSGTYSITVHDAFNTATGGYAVTAVSLGTGITPVTGGDAGPIASGVTATAAITVGDIDAFTIAGKMGGTLMATVGETVAGSPLTPSIELYNPSGKLLTSNYSASGVTITSANLPVDGTYTIIVRDVFGSGIGGYDMTPVSIGTGITQNAGTDAGPIASGVTKTAAISIGDIDAFTIAGKMGGTLMATVGETVAGSPLTPSIELYNPSGKLLTSNYSASGVTVTSANLPVDGTYTIIVRDVFGSGIGGYDMTPVSIGPGITQNSGGDGGFLASGSQRTAAISIGDIDAHPFYGVIGDKVVITVSESVMGSPLTPSLELYGPTGKLVTSNYGASGTTFTVNSLTTTGLYTIIVRDVFGSATGGYKLLLTQTRSAVKPTVTIAATDNLAVEGGFDNGLFTITRTNIRALPETINYTISGTAKNGVDYTKLTGTAVIPPNSASVGVVVTALTDTLKEGTESVILTLGSGPLYTVGSPKTATVSIDDPATVTGTVFADKNGNNKPDGGEGLSGWTVWIDINGNGVLDSADRKVVTNSSGSFTITGLPPGMFKVYVTQKTGYKLKSPVAGFDPVTLTIGNTVSGVLFNETKVA
jgi:hypothetical protein